MKLESLGLSLIQRGRKRLRGRNVKSRLPRVGNSCLAAFCVIALLKKEADDVSEEPGVNNMNTNGNGTHCYISRGCSGDASSLKRCHFLMMIEVTSFFSSSPERIKFL
ncbi:unnamed protein product [Caretta caretta]